MRDVVGALASHGRVASEEVQTAALATGLVTGAPSDSAASAAVDVATPASLVLSR